MIKKIKSCKTRCRNRDIKLSIPQPHYIIFIYILSITCTPSNHYTNIYSLDNNFCRLLLPDLHLLSTYTFSFFFFTECPQRKTIVTNNNITGRK